MIENKLHMKLLSLNKLAARLSSLNNMAGWSYTLPEKSTMFSGNSLLSFFGNEKKDADKNIETSSSDHLSGLNSAILSFRRSIKNLSERLSGFSPKNENKASNDKAIIQKSENIASNGKTIIQKNENIVSNNKNIIQNIYKDPKLGLKLFHTKTDKKEAAYHFREVATLLQNNYVKKEKFLETESFRKIIFPEKASQEKPSYTIHQTFGDIIVQPGSIDVSMQQLKVKIQDILKQARDSVY
jgi:hypothetical protein